MSINPAISEYMRDMQRKAAKSRWSKLAPAQRSETMKRVRAAREAKRHPPPSAQ